MAGEAGPMIIVAGQIHVAAAEREAYVDWCREVIESARGAAGCLDFHLSADPIVLGRINVHEEWDTVAAAETFRGSGPPDEQAAMILSADVHQHEEASSMDLTS